MEIDIEKRAKELLALGNGEIPVNLYTISVRLKIDIIERPTQTALMSPNNNPTIVLDTRKDTPHLRMEWAHEIGHFVLHAGNQLFLHELMTQKQEAQANSFARYFMLPTDELENMIFQHSERSRLLYAMAKKFVVPLSAASNRLKKFENQIFAR